MTDALNIDFVTETFAPEINGVAMTLGRLVDGLISRDCKVRVYRPRQSPGQQPRINGHYSEHLLTGMSLPMYKELKFGFPATRRLLAAWQKQRPDGVYIATEGPLGWSGVRAAEKLGIATMSGFHTNFHTYSRHYRLKLLEPLILGYLRRLHSRTGCTLVPTQSQAEQLRELSFGRVDVLQRGVDTRLFHPLRYSGALRRQWNVSAKQLTCIYVGRIAAEKNILTAVNAFRNIQLHTPDAKLVLVGDGPLRKTLAKEHPDFIFRGMRRGEDLARHYASADLFLFPSQSETFGNVVTEAMASGLTVVAYKLAAASEHIVDGENGALAENLSEAAFIHRAAEVSLQTAQLETMGRKAAEHASSLNWTDIVDRFIQLMEEQLHGKAE